MKEKNAKKKIRGASGRNVSIGGDVINSNIITGDNSYNLDTHFNENEDTQDIINNLGKEFYTQLRIAGYFQNDQGSLGAIYLDSDDLYVNRQKEEREIIKSVDNFLNNNKSEKIGCWISIEAEAGRGKSCFLWHLYRQLKEKKELILLPFLAYRLTSDLGKSVCDFSKRIINDFDNEKAPIIILIDTLDILVGINDQKLANNINTLISLGCLIITSSRPQEINKLGLIINKDKAIELSKYSDIEFKQITKKYIDKSYTDWSDEKRKRQFYYVSGLLWHKREISRDLDLEPLILRMIFEVYVPQDIPKDINTQMVYDQFWKSRVISDRSKGIKGENEKINLCRMMAEEIAFSDQVVHSDALPLDTLITSWNHKFSEPFPEESLENLISSGVLHWAIGNSAVRFFHQTFLEYTSAYDLINSTTKKMVEKNIFKNHRVLFEDVKNSNLFRSPILKQIALQDYSRINESRNSQNQQSIWRFVLENLRLIDNQLSAQICLEVIGKISEEDFCVKLFTKWIESNPKMIGVVIFETVKYYPQNRIKIALKIIEPLLHSNMRNLVLSLCKNHFALIAVDEVYDFLRNAFETIKVSGDINTKTIYKDALTEVLRLGKIQALNELATLFVYLTDGQRKGLLEKLKQFINSTNTVEYANFMDNAVFPVLARKKDGGAIWHSYLEIFDEIQKNDSELAKKLARKLLKRTALEIIKKNGSHTLQNTVEGVGKIIGKTFKDQDLYKIQIERLTSSNYLFRRYSRGLLVEASTINGNEIANLLLSIKLKKTPDRVFVESIYDVIAGLEGVKVEKFFQLIDHWTPVHGANSYLRIIFQKISCDDAEKTKRWFFQSLRKTETEISLRICFMVFEILSKTNIKIFSINELIEIHEKSKLSASECGRIFAGSLAYFVEIDEKFADKIINEVLDDNNQAIHTAAIMSFENAIDNNYKFLLSHINKILLISFKKNPRYLQILFNVLKTFPSQHIKELLEILRSKDIFPYHTLTDENILTEYMVLLNTYAKYEPNLAFSIISQIKIVSNMVADAMGVTLERIVKFSNNKEVIYSAASKLMEIICIPDKHNSKFYNSLVRSIPVLEKKLGLPDFKDFFDKTVDKIDNDNTLKFFLKAISNTTLWTPQLKTELIQRYINDSFIETKALLIRDELK